MPEKILITTRSFRKLDGPHQQILRDAGYEIINSPYDRPATSAELAAMVEDPAIVAIILGVDEVTERVIAAGESLRVLSRYGVGVDSIDIAAATAYGIPVTNTPGANSVAVAELTLALMLALSRHIPEQDKATKQGGFSPVSGWELADSVLGLVGFGRIGQEVARRAAAFGMHIQFYDPYPPPGEGLTLVSLEELFATSDFISLHLPLTEATHNMIDYDRMKTFKPNAFLINTARGGLVDEAALYDALRAGKIAGAAFDAFEQEPPTDNRLLRLENFIATPHTGSSTRQTTLRMGLMASRNALAVLRGERPLYVVNPEVYSR